MSDQDDLQGANSEQGLTPPSGAEAGASPGQAASGEVPAPQAVSREEFDALRAKLERAEATNRSLQSKADSAEAKLKQKERGELGTEEALRQEIMELTRELEAVKAAYADLYWGSSRDRICAGVGLPVDLWRNVQVESDEDLMRSSAEGLKKRIRSEEAAPPPPAEPTPPPAAPGIPQDGKNQDQVKVQKEEEMKKRGDVLGLINSRLFGG